MGSPFFYNGFPGAVRSNTVDRSLNFGMASFEMPALFDSSLVKCQFACRVAIKCSDLIDHPGQRNVREEMLSRTVEVKTPTNITMVAGKPNFFNIGVFMLIFKQKERWLEL